MDSENQQSQRLAPVRSACSHNEPTQEANTDDAHYWLAVLQLIHAIDGTSLDPSKLFFHDSPGLDPTVIPGRSVIWPLELKTLLDRKELKAPGWTSEVQRITADKLTGLGVEQLAEILARIIREA